MKVFRWYHLIQYNRGWRPFERESIDLENTLNLGLRSAHYSSSIHFSLLDRVWYVKELLKDAFFFHLAIQYRSSYLICFSKILVVAKYLLLHTLEPREMCKTVKSILEVMNSNMTDVNSKKFSDIRCSVKCHVEVDVLYSNIPYIIHCG